jgi:hypothetical protein
MSYFECHQCSGSISTSTGICGDCGFNEMEYINEFEAWVDEVPQAEAA